MAATVNKKEPHFGGFIAAMVFSGLAILTGAYIVNASEGQKERDARARARRGGRKHKLPG
jgi:hypothetical protein